jgi:hypothetical protein
MDEMWYRNMTPTGEKSVKDKGKKRLEKRRRRHLGVITMRWTLKKQGEIM